MKVLVIGLGNPILGDDGVGWQVAEGVERQLAFSSNSKPVEVERLSLGGLGLMERLIGYDCAIIVDAIVTGQHPPGNVSVFPLDVLPNPCHNHTTSSHDTSLKTALDLGRRIGAPLPENLWVVAVESKHVFDFSDTLSPAVARAVPKTIQTILNLLKQNNGVSHDLP